MAGGGKAATEKHILRAQKSTNQLKAMVANLLPPPPAGNSAGAVEVEAILSDISDSLSQALASLQIDGTSDEPPEARLSVSRRSGQRRSRADGSSRTVMLRYGDPGDAYPWRKYGQKGILGTRFPRNYYRCAQRSGCSARKQVQQSDDDPSQLEVTYVGAHTCGDRTSSPAAISLVDEARWNTATSHPRLQKWEDVVPASESMACTPSMEEDIAAPWLLIPSPACSQSELLSEAAAVEVPELRQDASPTRQVEHKKARDDDEFVALHDSVVPDFM
uniref:WRKY domain-containing protein n=1 Tax=Oryza punctata TaxID=4537 RepID=A0A0E0LK87_ORYPU